jgi:hypothetical protein
MAMSLTMDRPQPVSGIVTMALLFFLSLRNNEGSVQ